MQRLISCNLLFRNRYLRQTSSSKTLSARILTELLVCNLKYKRNWCNWPMAPTRLLLRVNAEDHLVFFLPSPLRLVSVVFKLKVKSEFGIASIHYLYKKKLPGRISRYRLQDQFG